MKKNKGSFSPQMESTEEEAVKFSQTKSSKSRYTAKVGAEERHVQARETLESGFSNPKYFEAEETPLTWLSISIFTISAAIYFLNNILEIYLTIMASDGNLCLNTSGTIKSSQAVKLYFTLSAAFLGFGSLALNLLLCCFLFIEGHLTKSVGGKIGILVLCVCNVLPILVIIRTTVNIVKGQVKTVNLWVRPLVLGVFIDGVFKTFPLLYLKGNLFKDIVIDKVITCEISKLYVITYILCVIAFSWFVSHVYLFKGYIIHNAYPPSMRQPFIAFVYTFVLVYANTFALSSFIESDTKKPEVLGLLFLYVFLLLFIAASLGADLYFRARHCTRYLLHIQFFCLLIVCAQCVLNVDPVVEIISSTLGNSLFIWILFMAPTIVVVLVVLVYAITTFFSGTFGHSSLITRTESEKDLPEAVTED